MSGAFYGSLAASASVFVAILTALLVNNYVQINSDRRQIRNELDRIEENLEGLKDRKEDYEDTVNTLVEKREADYRAKAEEQVNEFLESEVPSEYSKPVENLTVEELYQDLIDFHNCDSSENLEDSPINLHHRDILEEQIDEIESQVLKEVIPSFASKYEGDGWDPDSDPDRMGLAEKFEKLAEADEEEEGEQKSGGDEDSDSVIEIGDLEKDPIDLDEFIEKYKEEHGLDSLDDKSRDALETHYDDVVDKYPYEDDSPSKSTSGTSGNGPLGPIQRGIWQATLVAQQARETESLLEDMEYSSEPSILGLNVRERQKLGEARENLRDAENEIQILESREKRLEREKEGLHPEDLAPTLVANVATIVLSVVVPIFIYLIFVTNSQVPVPSWAWIISHTEVNVFLSWLLGLFIVFESIHARINDREPRAYSLYRWIRN